MTCHRSPSGCVALLIACLGEYERLKIFVGTIGTTRSKKNVSREKKLITTWVLAFTSNISERQMQGLKRGMGKIMNQTKSQQQLFSNMPGWFAVQLLKIGKTNARLIHIKP